MQTECILHPVCQANLQHAKSAKQVSLDLNCLYSIILKYKVLHRWKQVLAVNIPQTFIFKTNNGIFWIIISKSRTEQYTHIYAFKSEMSINAKIVRDVKT